MVVQTMSEHRSTRRRILLSAMAMVFLFLLACARADTAMKRAFPTQTTSAGWQEQNLTPDAAPTSTQVAAINISSQKPTPTAIPYTPTPDPERASPQIRDWYETYTVGYGDSLHGIAQSFGVGVQQIRSANGLDASSWLLAGQVLTIPPQMPEPDGPANKLLSDSALVYGPGAPSAENFRDSLPSQSALLQVHDEIGDERMDGLQVVEWVAKSYSINPAVLLAVLEMQSGWVFGDAAQVENWDYPMGWVQEGYDGLGHQLAWAADQLNAGFYRWRSGWLGPFVFAEGLVVPPGKGLNAATVAIQHLFSQLLTVEAWREAMGGGGMKLALEAFLANPFHQPNGSLLPADLSQPDFQLPFEEEVAWSFTGGPHSAWGNYAAWGALDFAPSDNGYGCAPSNDWVVAVSQGLILLTGDGQVLLDLDGDGDERTGWVVLYMHVDSWERVQAGERLNAADRIGHPSCEGGFSTGTHLHIARKYNGVWIEADGEIPFLMDGWVSKGAGLPYEGTLTKGAQTLYAHSGLASYNQIWR